jgi:hypothetical protein
MNVDHTHGGSHLVQHLVAGRLVHGIDLFERQQRARALVYRLEHRAAPAVPQNLRARTHHITHAMSYSHYLRLSTSLSLHLSLEDFPWPSTLSSRHVPTAVVVRRRRLVAAGAEVDYADNEDRTALDSAAEYRFEEAIQALVADVNGRDIAADASHRLACHHEKTHARQARKHTHAP